MKRVPVIALLFSSLAMAGPEPMPPPPLPGASGPPSAPPMPGPPDGAMQKQPPAPSPPGTAQPPGPSPAPPLPTASAAAPSIAKPAAIVTDVIPKAFPRDRYEASWKKNPFLLKTAPVAQAKESWATDYALTSIAKMSGTYRVSIKNKKTGESKRLTEGADASAEFKIVSVDLKPDRKGSSVEIERGGEKAKLTYDTAMTAPQARGAVPGQPPGMNRPGMPVIPGQPQGNVPLPNMRTTSTSGPPGAPGTSGSPPGFQRQQAMTSPPSYGGNPGGASYGGPPGFANTPTTTTSTVASGSPATSRLGGLGPRAATGGTGSNTLVPTAGSTYSANSGTAAGTDPGNVVTNATDLGSSTAAPSTIRRRTLIPAPVISQ